MFINVFIFNKLSKKSAYCTQKINQTHTTTNGALAFPAFRDAVFRRFRTRWHEHPFASQHIELQSIVKGHPSRNVDLRSDSVLASDSSKPLDEQTAIKVEKHEPGRSSVQCSRYFTSKFARTGVRKWLLLQRRWGKCIELRRVIWELYFFVYIFVCKRWRLININGEFKMGTDRKTKIRVRLLCLLWNRIF